MTSAYRRKLLNWITSILVATTTLVLAAATLWLVRLPQLYARDIDQVAGPVGETLIVYPALFLPAAVWHLFDFLQRGEPASQRMRRLASYRPFLACLAVSGLAWVLIASGRFEESFCPQLPNDGSFGFVTCITGPAVWLMFLCLGPLLFSLILCMGKAVISIRSHLDKAT